MASTRSIRKLHQMQMAVTIAVRRVFKELHEGSVTFACVDDAMVYLCSLRPDVATTSLALVHEGEAVVPKVYG